MKWLQFSELHCVVPSNADSSDRISIEIGPKKLNLGKFTYDDKRDLSRFGKISFVSETSIKLFDNPILGKKKILGEFVAKEKEKSVLAGELFFKNNGEYRLGYTIEFKNAKAYLKMVQLNCLRTASTFSQDKIYFVFNKRKLDTKFIVQQSKNYSLTKYPSFAFGNNLEISLFTSELLRSDKLIGRFNLKLEVESKGQNEIVFDRGTCLYNLIVEVFDFQVKIIN